MDDVEKESYRAESRRLVKAADCGHHELEMENDRMKTSIMILNQKLKMKDDDLKEEIEKLELELNQAN